MAVRETENGPKTSLSLYKYKCVEGVYPSLCICS